MFPSPMFDNFDISYNDNLTLDEFNRLGIIDGEIERLFYGEYRVIYPGIERGFVIGYTGTKMLVVDFRFDYDKNLVIIEEIRIANGYEIEERFCRPRCR